MASGLPRWFTFADFSHIEKPEDFTISVFLAALAAFSKNHMSRGFTLLELLIAMTILLMGLSALFHINNESRIASVAAEELATVQLACQTKMNELLATSGGAVFARGAEEIPNVNGWKMSVEKKPLNHKGIVVVRIFAAKQDVPVTDRNGHYELVRWILE